MAYPPQPGYPPPQYQPMPQAMPVKPNPATAIIAAVLAILGGLYAMARVFIALPSFHDVMYAEFLPKAVKALVVVELATSGVMTLLLIIGAILVFARKRSGQWLILAGSLFGVGLVVFSMLWVGVMDHGPVEALRSANVLTVFTIAVPSAATLVLILLAPTTRYLKRVPVQRFAQPPQQQWNQQQQWGQQTPRQW